MRKVSTWGAKEKSNQERQLILHGLVTVRVHQLEVRAGVKHVAFLT